MAKARKTSPESQQPSETGISGAAPSAVADPDIYRDRVAMRAYELYLARGGTDGADFDDWLAAEREIAGHNGTPDDGDPGE